MSSNYGHNLVIQSDMTVAQIAAIDFDQLSYQGECPIPTNEQWNDQSKERLFILRLAFVMLGKTKKDLVQTLRQVPEEFRDTTDAAFAELVPYLSCLLDLAKAGRARHMIAGAALAIEQTATHAPVFTKRRPSGRKRQRR